jgi:hypothetical protein
MTQTRTRPGEAGPGNAVCLGGERVPGSTTLPKYQAPSSIRAVLRLVPPSPRPRRLLVWFHVLDDRAPYGRAGPFKLTHDELNELIAVTARMEGRA